MWNHLFHNAYEDNCDYFFQCGDDIMFTTKNWVKDYNRHEDYIIN